MKDYCGPYWMPSFIRRFLSKQFNASCKIHDLDYDSKKFSRKEADVRFWENMRKQAKGNILWLALAVLFYVSVRIGGTISWRA